jgi:hypothetical protein
VAVARAERKEIIRKICPLRDDELTVGNDADIFARIKSLDQRNEVRRK